MYGCASRDRFWRRVTVNGRGGLGMAEVRPHRFGAQRIACGVCRGVGCGVGRGMPARRPDGGRRGKEAPPRADRAGGGDGAPAPASFPRRFRGDGD